MLDGFDRHCQQRSLLESLLDAQWLSAVWLAGWLAGCLLNDVCPSEHVVCASCPAMAGPRTSPNHPVAAALAI
jgi:hypothetical protein